MKNNKKGFTLIELLVVIAIIGLLSTLAVIALGSARQKARDSKRVSDIRQVQTAFELYYTDVGSYPESGGAAVALEMGRGTDCTTACDTVSLTNGLDAIAAGTTYMALVPPDPSGTAECAITATSPTGSGCSYSYRTQLNVSTNYCISFWLEGDPDGTGLLAAGAQNATSAGIQSGGCAF